LSESNDWKVPGSGAEIYETVFVPAMMGEWASRGMALANPQSEERVLDVACGTGVLTRLVAKTIGPKGRVIGLDFNSEMLAEPAKLPLSQPVQPRLSGGKAMPPQCRLRTNSLMSLSAHLA
jgi:SAM-dependent methyltransferase